MSPFCQWLHSLNNNIYNDSRMDECVYHFLICSQPVMSQIFQKPVFRMRSIVILFPNCFDLLWEKIAVVIEKKFGNSRLKAENLHLALDITRTIYSTSALQWKVGIIFERECLFNLFWFVGCTLTVIYLDFILFMIIDKFSPVPIIIINNFVNICWHHTYKWMSDKYTGCKIIHNRNFFCCCKWFRQVKNLPHNNFLIMLEFGTFKSC